MEGLMHLVCAATRPGARLLQSVGLLSTPAINPNHHPSGYWCRRCPSRTTAGMQIGCGAVAEANRTPDRCAEQLQTIANPICCAAAGGGNPKSLAKLSPNWLHILMMLDDVLGS